MKTALLKDGIKEIKYSYKRFLSILLIVLLGVGFFAGLRAASPDMKKTLDMYFDDLDVMDIQVISSLGLTLDDIEAIKQIDGVDKVEGSYMTDAIIKIGDEESVIKLETYSDNINKLNLIEGKLPENEDECVVEARLLEENGLKIGDSINVKVEDITNDDGEKQKVLNKANLKIVGSVKSPMYISTDRGSTDLGSGTIDYYVYISKENINADIYTNIYITAKGAKDLNTTYSSYFDKVDELKNKLEEISEERRQARYDQLYDSANSKVEEAQSKLDEEKQKAEKEFKEAQDEIDSGKEEIEDGYDELESNRSKANKEFSSAQKQIDDAKKKLEENEEEFRKLKAQTEKQIDEYEESLSSLKELQSNLNTNEENLKKANEELKSLNNSLQEALEEEKEEIQNKINEKTSQIQIMQGTILAIQNSLKEMGVSDLDKTIKDLETGINTAKAQLENGEKKISDAKNQILKNEEELEKTKNNTYYELNQAEEELKNAEKEIKDGEEELKQAKEEYEKEIEDAEEELLQAKEDLKEIKRPDWYILTRDENAGYASYVQDTDRVASLAQVFPVVFFLVAALISLTSMSRMVEEERVEIGTLKALGYGKRQISSKYLIYASLATVIGGIVGLIIGFKFLPGIVANMYAMVYEVPDVVLEYNFEIAFVGMFFAILCTVGATLYTCIKELIQNPATLMRPKAPKPGKRVILEKIPFIWKHLNFTAKVTARNLFRYKKRFLMTIIGVCGCTALIVAGFGLRDAIGNMIPKQFGEIYKYNVSINLKEEESSDDLNEVKENIQKNEDIIGVLGANVQSVKIIKNDNNQNIQLIIPEDVNKLENFISLRNRKSQDEKYVLDNSGVIISEKLANLLDIKKGDSILLENSDGDRANVNVTNITENYLMHYIYISQDLYNTTFDTKVKYNMIYAITNSLTPDQEENLGTKLLEDSSNISGVSFTSAAEGMFTTVMDNMDMVVWILIIAAGLLALVVLYNLLNANISERIRELATIKVLGFYDREVYSYIARETIILTVIGILLGLIGGYFLTMYILKTCELDITMFDPEVKALSYVFGVVITVFFAIIVNIVTYFSLKKIDMIESLKSVE